MPETLSLSENILIGIPICKVGRPFPAPASFSGTHFLKEFSKDFQRKYWDSKYMLLNFLVYFFILLILDSGNFDIMTNFTLKIFSLYEWLSFWINLRFGCNIEFLKLIKTHPTFHRYYPCWLCLKHWLKAAFLSSRISESDDKKIGLILRYYKDIILCQITTVNYG